jgi:hypothetical protein
LTLHSKTSDEKPQKENKLLFYHFPFNKYYIHIGLTNKLMILF